MKNTVIPPVEFVQGIPIDLDKDEFINPTLRNLIVVDDLMSSMAKDARFNDLFCEGSHHRNMSVIGINQNLYFSKDPTQRRNCHYLILFKNPVDKQQIMTLARQMYPGKTAYLLEKFDKATQGPRAYLIVDLKVTTPEALRFRSSVFDKINTEVTPSSIITRGSIKQEVNTASQFAENIRSDNMPFTIKPTDIARNVETPPTTQVENITQFENMPSCDDCGLVFDTSSDVQRHIKNWCPENKNLKRKREDSREPTSSNMTVKKIKSDSQVWAELIGSKVFHSNRRVQNAIKKYIKQGYSQRKARYKSMQDNLPALSKDFRKAYVQLMTNMTKLEQDPVHAETMKTAKQLETDFGMNREEAIQQAVKLRKSLINGMIEALTKDENQEDDENDGSDNLESEVDIQSNGAVADEDEEED